MIIIDSGNTACKIWVGKTTIVKKYSEEFSESERDFLKSKVNELIGFSTVAPHKFTSVVEILKELGFKKFVNVGEFAKKENLVGSKVRGIGADRILGMIGAATFLKTPLTTVDCGTAVTVNFLKEKNLCIGGAIFAGYTTQMNALLKGTEGIYYNDEMTFKKAIGTVTEEALQSGILYSIAGGIILLKENFQKESGIEDLNLVITGGDGEMVFKKLRENNIDCSFKKDLIKMGIESVLKTMGEKQKEY